MIRILVLLLVLSSLAGGVAWGGISGGPREGAEPEVARGAWAGGNPSPEGADTLQPPEGAPLARRAPSPQLDPAVRPAPAPPGGPAGPLPLEVPFAAVPSGPSASFLRPRPPTPGAGGEEARLLAPARFPSGAEADTVLASGGLLPPWAPGPRRLQVVDDLVNLGVRLQGRTELGGNWLRFRPCDQSVRFSCDPSLVPQFRPEMQFGVQVAGTVADRVVVDVDYDQTREFSAANRINVRYQGQEGELLRQVDVGDVTFALPESRFLTEGIPAGNFGLLATGGGGPLEVQAVFAQQRGDVSSRAFQLAGGAGARGFVQEDTLVVDDADYTRGQFFFLADPARLANFPHVDVLSLTPGDAPAETRPGGDPIQLYRYANEPVTQQQVEGYIQAVATAGADGLSVAESGWFRFLQPGIDYFVHPSGLWVALRSPLRQDEMLAVTYITAAGDTVGDYNPERLHNQGVRPRLELLKASGPNHQPGRPTWDREMHQVYRVSGSNDVELTSVELSISLGELSAGRTFKRAPDGTEVTLLKLFGVDEEAPFDRVDRAVLYRPADESLEDPAPVSGTFLFFPTLRPFQAPPPVPSLALTAEDAGGVLGPDRNDRIYDDPDPVNRANGGLFRLTLPFRVRSEGVISSFSLGALGIRDGSERLTLADRLLVNGQDYLIDYDVGLVTLLEPEGLFAANPEAVLRASWEQKPIFQVAPTSVFGLSARTRFGDRGGVHALGLYQTEQALVNRPTLGMEPGAMLLGGVGGDLRFRTPFLDRAVARVPGLRSGEGTGLRVSGELAVSAPEPNTRGDVFLDDFDGTNDLAVSLLSSNWRLGSAPAQVDAASAALPPVVDVSTVARLTWQHSWIVESPVGDSAGVFEGFFPEQIDRQINVTGSPTRETALRLNLLDQGYGPGGVDPGVHRWRSITTVLSTTGLDLSRSEYLEVYVAGGDSLTLVFDLGRVSEDAFFVDPLGQTSGTRSDGRPWGLGLLDQEADPRVGEIWGDEADERGVWGEVCRATRGAIYRVGDIRANCTRGNGRPDSEDLDGNGVLDTEERVVRFAVPLDGSSPFLARDRVQTGTGFRLYRIPLRGAEGVGVGGVFSEADWRAVRHLRVTATGRRSATPVLARMRITGSRWVKRGMDGAVSGIAGDLSAMGRVEVSSVSRVTEGQAYQAPPGVLEQLDDPTGAIGGRGVEFNEKSLGLLYEDLGAGARAEVYNRFPQRPRNFLTYRRARLWMVARRGDWGLDRPTTVFLKVGSDSENFYLFRSKLTPVGNPEAVAAEDWLPELVVDFDEWLTLRTRAEELLLLDPPPPGSPPLEVWSADSTYAVVMRDRARAPSLAAVRELSLGIWNEGALPTSGEVWVNELRLGGGVRDAGFAGSLNVELDAGGVLSTRLNVTNRGAFFRQLKTEASYLDDREVTLSSTLQLGRLAPEAWGIEVPLTVTWGSTGQDPTFLDRSDVLAERLDGLRPTGADRTRVTLGFRKRTPTENPWLGLLLDGLDARLGYGDVRTGTVTSEVTSRSVDAGVGYRRVLESRTVPLLPGFVRGILAPLLPSGLEARLEEARLRWTPERVGFSAAYLNQETRAQRFDQILARPGDAGVEPTRSPREGVESLAEVAFRPLSSVTAEVALVTHRDLLDPARATADPALRPVLEDQRRSLGGMDLGWETNRSLRSRLGWSPRLTSWLRTDLDWTTQYLSDRNAGYVRRTPGGGIGADTLLELQRNVSGQRDLRARAGIDPAALMVALVGPPPPLDPLRPPGSEVDGAALLRAIGEAMLPLNVTFHDGVNARFNRAVVSPGGRYQLGLGGVDDFRFLSGDTAAFVADRGGWTGSGGTRLPGGLLVNAEFSQADVATLDARSERDHRVRTWPSLRLSAPDIPVPGVIRPLVQRVTVSAGYTVQSTLSVVGASDQRRSREDRAIPVSVSVRWFRTLSTSYTASFQDGEGRDPTGDTERTRETHSFSLSSSFRPGIRDLAARLERPIQVTLRVAYSDQVDCRITAARDVCTAYVDQLTRDMNLTLDTSVSGVELGVQASYFDRRSFVGQRAGSTQLQVGVFARFNVGVGNLAMLPGG